MAILGNIRKSGNTFVVIVIAFLVIMFLGGELARVVPYLFSSKGTIGKLSGKKISYIDYRKVYETIQHNLSRQNNQQATEDQIRDYAWSKLVENMLYIREIDQAGLTVGTQELIDLVQGEHIDAKLKHAFKDPKTNAFDKQKLLTYLSNLSKSQQEWWCQVEKELALERAKEKLRQLMIQSCFTTTLETAQTAVHASLFCNVDYLHIPFHSIKNDVVRLTNQQLLDYMVAHKSHYTALSESRTIKYITFPIQPDEKDNADFQKALTSLTAQFATTTDPYAFAKQHTDGNLSATRLVCTTETLPTAFTTIKHTLKKGMVVGPIAGDSFHIIYKLVQEEKGNYEIAVIEKKAMVSDHTRNKHFRKVQQLTGSVKKTVDFDRLATDANLSIQQETVAPSDGSIGSHTNGRKVVRWLYNEGRIGKISPLFDLGNVYLLAVMVDQVKAGDLVPLDSVFRKVYQKVLHQEKSKIILDKLKQIEATTLQGIAEQYGQDITVQSIERLHFLENDAPHLKKAHAFIGKCFGLGLNIISDPIIDDTGIYLAYVKSKDQTAIQENHHTQIGQIERWMQTYYISTAMEALAEVRDERYKIE
ncbi:SurA N-terminal domain-containing protein [Cardinium endosymbiont of Philonthus spinipes]|uniref:SurA N-terminal domain-containing protein n=1 Tax=Cardinium endosymbiont of Philonthus spinipes TaxID=3077941 RepID=UPI00313C2554